MSPSTKGFWPAGRMPKAQVLLNGKLGDVEVPVAKADELMLKTSSLTGTLMVSPLAPPKLKSKVMEALLSMLQST